MNLNIIMLNKRRQTKIKNAYWGFAGGTVVKNLPASRGHGFEPWSGKILHATKQLLSLCSRAREPQLLSLHTTTTEAHTPRARAPQQEKPQQ